MSIFDYARRLEIDKQQKLVNDLKSSIRSYSNGSVVNTNGEIRNKAFQDAPARKLADAFIGSNIGKLYSTARESTIGGILLPDVNTMGDVGNLNVSDKRRGDASLETLFNIPGAGVAAKSLKYAAPIASKTFKALDITGLALKKGEPSTFMSAVEAFMRKFKKSDNVINTVDDAFKSGKRYTDEFVKNKEMMRRRIANGDMVDIKRGDIYLEGDIPQHAVDRYKAIRSAEPNANKGMLSSNPNNIFNQLSSNGIDATGINVNNSTGSIAFVRKDLKPNDISSTVVHELFHDFNSPSVMKGKSTIDATNKALTNVPEGTKEIASSLAEFRYNAWKKGVPIDHVWDRNNPKDAEMIKNILQEMSASGKGYVTDWGIQGAISNKFRNFTNALNTSGLFGTAMIPVALRNNSKDEKINYNLFGTRK